MSTLPGWFVVIMGISVVFIGLIAIIGICKLLSVFCSSLNMENPNTANIKENNENKNEVVAAISAAIAEETGKDTKCIKILSIRRV